MGTGVHLCTHVFSSPHITGYVYCLQGRRLLDQLNEMFPGILPEVKEFLLIREGEMYALRGERKTVQFSCLNKTNILFVREFEGG